MDRKTVAPELPETDISNNVASFSKAIAALELPETNISNNVALFSKATAALELSKTNISNNRALFNKAVLEAAKIFIPRRRRRDYQPYWTPERDNLHNALD